MNANRVLVIEDEGELAELLSQRLSRHSFEVTVATDGQAGLEAARQSHPDVIVLDVMMPRLNGFQVCRALQNDALLKNIPVLFLSAKAQESDRLGGLELGAAGYMTKPFSMQALVSKVAELAHQHVSEGGSATSS